MHTVIKIKRILSLLEKVDSIETVFICCPNLLTTSALFAGFYAIIAAMSGRFEIASVVILIAIVFDGLDGRVARLTNTESDFGAAL